MRPLGGGVLMPVRRAISQLIDDRRLTDSQKPAVIFEVLEARPWQSLTFIGHQLVFELRLIGTAEAVATAHGRLAARLAETELIIPGHFVADATLAQLAPPPDPATTQRRLRVEVLVIED